MGNRGMEAVQEALRRFKERMAIRREGNPSPYDFVIQNPAWKYRRMKIAFTYEAYSKMLHYTRATNGEISGFGKIKVSGDTCLITDVRIFKQECTEGSTVMDKEALGNFVLELAQAEEPPEEWKLWWHSHNDFGVFFSGIDDATARELSERGVVFSVCVNKKGKMAGRVDERGQVEESIDVEVIPRPSLYEECAREVKSKVSYKVYPYTQWNWTKWKGGTGDVKHDSTGGYNPECGCG
jgi:proteasome lid subunit RPN8/RPN11